jgi:hypothetical protein
MEAGEAIPPGALAVAFDAAGRSRRIHAPDTVNAPATAARLASGGVFCFHPGPYSVCVVPFESAPEIGLRIQFAVDTDDSGGCQHRFDLFLFSEAPSPLSVAALGAALQDALRLALTSADGGALELPPCTSLEEWHAFRAGLNQLAHARFGLMLDDCIPVDLGAEVDYAAQLAARAVEEAGAPPGAPPGATPGVTAGIPELPKAFDPAADGRIEPVMENIVAQAPQPKSEEPADPAVADAAAMRRLFLELPALTAALRQAGMPQGPLQFSAYRKLLQRLDLLNLESIMMPSLAWAAPDRPLDLGQQARRARHSMDAVKALEEAWTLLARLQASASMASSALLDEGDRIVSNLEYHFARRREPFAQPAPDTGARAEPSRREPT